MTEKMNALRNKKGFTLIEMLVVIAIIAVLVAIVVPTVSSSTLKASAATNAANLRTAAAQIAVDLVDGKATKNGTTITYVGGATAPTVTYKPLKDDDLDATDTEFKYALDTNGNVICYFGTDTYNVNYFATIAETGKAPNAGGQGGSGEQGGGE